MKTTTSIATVSAQIKAKIALFAAVFSIFALATATLPQIAEAATPTLAFASAGTNYVQISVQGDQNQAVNLYYYNPGMSTINTVGSIGTTNASGYFSTTLYTSSYNIPSGASVYVVVNGQQSSTAIWPTTAGGNVYLSQSIVTMNQGQNSYVSISGGTGNNYYINSNSNSGIVTATISGSTLSLNAVAPGYATINVCSLSSSAGCASLSVTVNSTWGGNGGNYSGSIYLSPSSVTVAPGQTQTVTISNYNSGYYYGNQYGYQTYYIANNPGSQYFSASISGNTVTVYGNNPGSATINICSQYSGTSCASLYVTVSNNYYNYNNGYYNGSYYGGTTYTYPYNYYSYPNYTYTYPTTYTNPVTYTYPSTTYTSGSNLGSSVSGVFLSQVPATGISLGLKMVLFTVGLTLWSLFAAFMIARKRGGMAVVSSGASNAGVHGVQNAAQTKAEAFKLANMKKKGLI